MRFEIIPLLVIWVAISFIPVSCDSDDTTLIPSDTLVIDSIDSISTIGIDCITEEGKISQENGGGCIQEGIEFFVFLTDTSVIHTKIDSDEIIITDSCRTYPLDTKGISVYFLYEGSDSDSIYFNYCTDDFIDLGTPIEEILLEGQISIVSDKKEVLSTSLDYQLSIEFNNLYVQSIDSTIQLLKFHQILMRWPGP